jgi:large subunit ribosomal protein L4
MVSLPIYDKTGKTVGSMEIDLDAIAPKISKQLLHDAVVMYQANARQGSRGTRSRGMVAGSTKKMYRQKGTGRARAGSRRSPIRRGGGHGFALAQRDFSYRLPKTALRLATRMAVAGKLKNEQVVVIDELRVAEPKTRDIAAVLQALNLGGQTTVIATDGYDPVLYKSARNLADVTVSPVGDLNAWSVLRPRRMLFTKAALESFRSSVAAESRAAASRSTAGSN